MNWAFSKPRTYDLDVATSGTQTPNILEITSENVERNTSKLTLNEEFTPTTEMTTIVEEIHSLPSSSKQNFEINEIANECSGRQYFLLLCISIYVYYKTLFFY
jgi:hypothetical protein